MEETLEALLYQQKEMGTDRSKSLLLKMISISRDRGIRLDHPLRPYW